MSERCHPDLMLAFMAAEFKRVGYVQRDEDFSEQELRTRLKAFAPAEERETPDEMVVTDSVRTADGGDIRVVCRGEVARMAFHAGFKAGHEAAEQVAAQSCSYSEEYYWMRSQLALPAEDRAVTVPQEPEIQGLRDMLRLQMSLKDDYLRLADKYGEKLSALTHAVAALREEMEAWSTAGDTCATTNAIQKWAAILKEFGHA